jgi:formylglycine-generating enzyme required for sulfatase activity
VNVTWFQANEACIAAGKRLAHRAEWLAGASGTPDTSVCNVASGGARAAAPINTCVSAAGAHDMIGNVWEWTDEWYAGLGNASSNTPNGTPATDGWPTDGDLYRGDGTRNIASSAFPGGGGPRIGIPSAAFRGGAWGDGARAGVFALGLDLAPSAWNASVGFRCVLPGGVR